MNAPYSEGYTAWQSYLFSNVSRNPPVNPYAANTTEYAEWERGGDDASCDYDNFMYST